jgi:hypothetical protein
LVLVVPQARPVSPSKAIDEILRKSKNGIVNRLRLFDLRMSRLPRVIGACAADMPRIAEAVNTAQRRLLYAKEAGEESWWGTWAEIAFNVSRDNPHITLPRGVARMEFVNICSKPVPIRNQFYEYLEFGNGRMPKRRLTCPCPELVQSYSRNNAITFTDLTNVPVRLVAYITDPTDADKRILFQGTNAAGAIIYNQDGIQRVQGEYVVLELPFSTSVNSFSSLTGIQKDVTNGEVQIFQMDSNGNQTLLLVMEPSETTALYRRYFFHPLPLNCCLPATSFPCPTTILPANVNTQVQVTAIAKLELIPVQYDTDYTLIQNMEAIIEECASTRYSEIDTPSAKEMAQERHTQAIRLLNGELAHYLGINKPAVNVQVFGSARLSRVKIGMI